MTTENKSLLHQLGEDSWGEYRQLVLKELERLNDNYESLMKEVVGIKVEIGQLNVKAGVWGLTGAAIPVALMLVVEFLKK
jgi:hypothetical protein